MDKFKAAGLRWLKGLLLVADSCWFGGSQRHSLRKGDDSAADSHRFRVNFQALEEQANNMMLLSRIITLPLQEGFSTGTPRR